MKVYGWLEKADFENLSADPTPASRGRVYFNETLGRLRLYDGSAWVTVVPVPSTPATKTANYSVSGSDGVLLGDATSGSITMSLPAAANFSGSITIKKIDSSVNSVIIDAAGAELIDGQAQQNLDTQYSALTLVSTGTAWVII